MLLGYRYLYKQKSKTLEESNVYVYLLTLFVLFLVGSTGWFLSPFFFALYLTAIIIAFTLTPTAASAYIFILVFFLGFNVGDLQLAYDFVIILSLLSVLPISISLRSQYLMLKETSKEILILREKLEKSDITKVEEILENKVNNFSVTIREPLNDVKQLAYRLEDITSPEDRKRYQSRLVASIESALSMLKAFEAAATGRKLLSKSTDTQQPATTKN